MSNLLIRNVDPALHAQLKARARAHRRSLEAEARELLRAGIAREAGQPPKTETLPDIAARLFGPEHGVELELPSRHAETERPPPDFGMP